MCRRHVESTRRQALLLLVMAALSDFAGQPAFGGEPQRTPTKADDELSAAAAKVDVQPRARDDEIRARLLNVLEATGWFESPKVQVEDGVVFLAGLAQTDQLKKWAGDLARNTQDVVAVVNRMDVPEPSVWDFTRSSLGGLWRDFLRVLPLAIFGVMILGVSLGVAAIATRLADGMLQGKVRARLLRAVIARGVGVMVFLFGVYLILRTSGLTQLALTVVGGTGLLGLVLGIAFRDITENFLASIFLSMQQPFATGDLVEIEGITGYVQQLNVRTTILMTLEGNLVQIPNATVYKSKLRNFTTNANRREDFVVGIGYDDPIQRAQEVARLVLADHPAVLNDPEPSVLVDSLGSATVNLRVYFWLNGQEHSWLKVRSSVIRLVKIAFQKNGISMPDEAREVVFPNGVPVTMVNGEPEQHEAPAGDRRSRSDRDQPPEEVTTKAEAGLYSEAGVIKEQARQARPLEQEENLLRGSPGIGA